MKPHQERVVQERTDLAEKLEKLDAFLGDTAKFRALDFSDGCLLVEQSEIMRAYVEVLDARIARFA
jgi:hypothetical protein